MTRIPDPIMDIVKELRLRRWAREHYVPREERGVAWHAVVLHEMRLKDDELLIQARSRPPLTSFVPLVPTAIQRVHPGHNEMHEPVLSRSTDVAQPAVLR